MGVFIMKIKWKTSSDDIKKLDKSFRNVITDNAEIYNEVSDTQIILKVSEVKGNYVEIDNITYKVDYKSRLHGYILLYCTIDVLTTFNSEIKNLNVRVTRYNKIHDAFYPDTLRPTKAYKRNIVKTFSGDNLSNAYSTAEKCYIVIVK